MEDYRALIAITSCRRVDNIKAYILPYIWFAQNDARFELVVALDGYEEEYVEFCAKIGVDLVIGADRMGVCISKNRVLTLFPDKDFYFFLDDDVELLDGGVFYNHIAAADETGISHFNLYTEGGSRVIKGEDAWSGGRIRYSAYGGGQFTFFSGNGLKKVGGWHDKFAEYRRFGHTEHTYRFYNAGLTPQPFCVLVEESRKLIWHYPESVTISDVARDEFHIAVPERELMDLELKSYPVKTVGAYYLAAANTIISLPSSRYAFLTFRQKRKAWSDYWIGRFIASSSSRRVLFATLAFLLDPTSKILRHHIKYAYFK